MHSLCAFANDFQNLGGGYIIVGIVETDGVPELPPIGLLPNQVEACQKKLLEISKRIIPSYFPVSSVEIYQGKHILVLWCTGGDNRPYKCPKAIVPNPNLFYYIRKSSNSVVADMFEERQLIELANRIPFDDRVNHEASVADLKLPLIQSFLKEVGSELYQRASTMPFLELCQQLRIIKGPPEYVRPVNVGLLLFNEQPVSFFRGARIDVVLYYDEVGDTLEERIFEGPVHAQLRSALLYIRNSVIAEKVVKVADQAEAKRFFNYPYAAIEEALANAVFHRSYEVLEPIEINIRLDKIEILSFPGAVPPVDNASLQRGTVIARTYRNRRIGDFLKDLRLTEGRGTGLPKIRRTMALNGSPAPIFETDDDRRSYFLVTLPIHPNFGLNPQPIIVEEVDYSKAILNFSLEPKSRTQILEHINAPINAHYYRKHLRPLIDKGLLAPTIPDKPTSTLQKYITTIQGKHFLKER